MADRAAPGVDEARESEPREAWIAAEEDVTYEMLALDGWPADDEESEADTVFDRMFRD